MFGEIAAFVISLVFAALSAAVGPAVKRLLDAIGLEKDGELADQLEGFIQKGVNIAKRRSKKAGKDLTNNFEVENEVVEEAVMYVDEHAPKILKKLGLTQQNVRKMVEEYLD